MRRRKEKMKGELSAQPRAGESQETVETDVFPQQWYRFFETDIRTQARRWRMALLIRSSQTSRHLRGPSAAGACNL